MMSHQNSNELPLKAREPTTQMTSIKSSKDSKKIPEFYDNNDESIHEVYYFENRSCMDKIISRLYLGNDVVAQDLKLLKENKITHILNLTTNIPNKFEHIVYKKIIMLDIESQNIRQYFDESFEFIDESLKNDNNSVLVHCNAGVSRSTSFIIAYLLQKHLFKSYSDALHYVKKRRPVVSPNYGFEKQLIKLEKKCKKKDACNLM